VKEKRMNQDKFKEGQMNGTYYEGDFIPEVGDWD